MRDKHISAQPEIVQERSSQTRALKCQRTEISSDSTSIFRSSRSFIFYAILCSLFLVVPQSISALNQIQNSAFNNIAGWDPTYVVDPGDVTSISFGLDSGALRAYFRTKNTAAPALGYSAYFTATQTILATPRSTDVNARLSIIYKESMPADTKCRATHQGTIRKTSDPGTIIPDGTFHYISHLGTEQVSSYGPPTVTEMTFEAGSSYLVYLYLVLTGDRNYTIQVWVDNITCNISPSGMAAVETNVPVPGSARGGCQLTWDASTPGTGANGLSATSPYRVYCSYTSEAGPWTQIATMTTATTTYTASPTQDLAWYAVSDVDTAGIESPLSKPVKYSSAKLQITKVETTTTSVTKGQNGLPVSVYITNTGSNSATIGTVELFIDSPVYGVYSIGAPSPALPQTIAGGESKEFILLVNVAGSSVSGVDYIDAKCTGTNSVTLATIEDPASDVKAYWLIQEPPNLKILDITASPTVYLDQTGAGIYLTVRNDGEAAAVWDLWNNTEMHFVLGAYLNLRPYGVSEPYSEVILNGETKIIRYDIDISPLSATGTTTINASMSYVDGNTYNAFVYDIGDTTPPSWTIRSGILKTYRGPVGFPAWTIEADSFNLGNFTVYTKGSNLQPDKDYRMRWYKPDGSQVQADMVSTDLAGMLSNSYTLSSDLTYLGKWRVIVSRVTNEIPLCETYFNVVDPASLSIQVLLPGSLTVNQPFEVTSRLVNSGGSRVDTAYVSPLTLDAGNTGTAVFDSGPSHALVTVEPYSYTDITWDYTAGTVGSFTVLDSGYGVDSNDLRNLTAATATSNMCMIQNPPVIEVSNIVTADTVVYLNQHDLTVTMDIENTGQASVLLNVASLTFSQGVHYQTLESPALPYLLVAGSPVSFTFKVAVGATSPVALPAAVTIRGYAEGLDANWPTSPNVNHTSTDTDSWTIQNEPTGFCSREPDFTTEQYTFNVGQEVWARYTNTLAERLRILFLERSGTPDNATPVTDHVDAVGGVRTQNYTVPGPAGDWKTMLYKANAGSGNLQTFRSLQYFRVQNPGSITASLTFVPDDIELNDEVRLVLTLSNNVTLGSTLENIVPTLPLKYSTGSGALTLLTGPDPVSATLEAGTSASFTWIYRAIQHTGAGSYQMIATSTGNDSNLATTDASYSTSTVTISGPLTIRYRDLSYASATLDFGTMVCGESKIVGTSKVNNLGSTDLTHTSWNKGFYDSAAADLLHPSQLSMYPLSGFFIPVAAPAATSTYAELHMPYNQPAGSYIATMSVFEDMPTYNGVLDAGEPNYVFNSIVTASQCRVIYTLPESVSLGDWKIGNTVATKTITIYNGGNLLLEKVKIKQQTATDFTLTVTPGTAGDMTTTASKIASISGYIDAAATDGNYVIDFIVWEDLNDDGNPNDGRASATFQLEIGIGNQLMHFTPAFIDFGNATPTFPLPEASFKITNIGDKTLSCLKCIVDNMYSIATPAFYIPAEEIELTLPASISVLATGTAYINAYVPAGMPIGTYTGTVTIFEDEDGDGTYLGDDNEAPEILTLQMYVVPYRGLRVLTPIADAGPLSKLETGIATFSVKNTGNILLTDLGWEKIPLSLDGVPLLNEINYDFDPQPPQPANTIFSATMTLTVPDEPAILDGDYIGQYALIYDDLPPLHPDLAGDPTSPFTVSCQVGTKFIDIVETDLLIVDAMPSLMSDTCEFTLDNIGTLILNRPMATASALVGPTTTIPATASIFVPGVFEYMIKNKTLTGTWQVNVPPGTPEGTYTGIITVWNDTNGNSAIDDPAEASDTANLELRVIAKTVIGVSPTTLDFGYVAPERSSSVNFTIVNLGNQDIASNVLAVASWLPPLAPGPIPIPAANLTFGPVPFTNSIPVGGSVPAVATITIPAGQSTVTYQGIQRVYIDTEVPLASYTAGEVFATFTARVSVGNKKISVADVNMGSHLHATTAITNFTLFNTGDINTNRIRWIAGNIGNGTATLTPTLSPNGSAVAGGTLNSTANVVIPAYTPPGIYTGIQTVFDDDLTPFDNILDPAKEASDTFLLTLTVATSPALVITAVDTAFPVTVSLGQKVAVNVTYQNTGNVTLSDLSWGSPMATMNGSDGGTMVPTFSPNPLPSLAPGATYIASITFEADPAQATGTYTGVQTLDSTVYPVASVNIAPSVLVVAQTGPKNLEAGTVFQSIATETFSGGDDFIFSAYVGFEDGLPASATIGFRQDKSDDTPSVPMVYVTIDQNGNLDPAGAGGIAGRIRTGNKTWYRLFLKFNGSLDALTESTYLILSNSSSIVGTDVWFDGVQLEKASGRNRPTAYGEGSKIYSPNNRIDLEGKAQYSEW